MRPTQSQKTKKYPGRARKAETEKLVLVGGKVTPEVAAILERIAERRRWTMSGTIRYACDLLVESEMAKAA